MTKIAPRICGMATAAVVTGGLAFGAMAAEDLQRFHIKLVGGAIGMYQTKAIEMPWAETVGKESNGQVTAEILPHDMVGIPYLTVLRLLSVGALEFSRGVVSSMGGDNPRFEGLDHPGLTPTLADYRKAVDAYRPVLNALFEKEWKVKLLRISPNPPQVIWCNAVIKKVADLSGLKVRVYNKGLAAFVTGAGGTPITMPSQGRGAGRPEGRYRLRDHRFEQRQRRQVAGSDDPSPAAQHGLGITVLGRQPVHVEPPRCQDPGFPGKEVRGIGRRVVGGRRRHRTGGHQLQRRARALYDAVA